MELFYNATAKTRVGKMRLQTDPEFKQRNMKECNKNFNVKMYSNHLSGRKAFVAEQKICEPRKLL